MTRKSNRGNQKKNQVPASRKQLEAKLGSGQPIRIFGCSDCELLIVEYPDMDSISCPWCRKQIDVYASYSYMAFAPGVQFSRTFGGQEIVR